MVSNAVAIEMIEEAKAVVAAHERYAREGNLEGIVSNVAEDIVLIAPKAPLLTGKEAFRAFYGDLLGMGTWDFRHEYTGAEVVAEVILLYGVSRGTFTPHSGEPQPILNNFLLMLRRNRQGLRVWRGAFTPVR